MPDPNSLIPPVGAAPATNLMMAPLATLQPSIPEQKFHQIFPHPFKVRAMDLYEAKAKQYPTDRTYWEYLDGFEYVSPTWGSILVPQGFPTDFASVPPWLHSAFDDDSPIMLYPSAPHDLLFVRRADGTRGWLANGKQLTLTQVNHVLTEAMGICGAGVGAQLMVFTAVEAANQHIRNEFAHHPAQP